MRGFVFIQIDGILEYLAPGPHIGPRSNLRKLKNLYFYDHMQPIEMFYITEPAQIRERSMYVVQRNLCTILDIII